MGPVTEPCRKTLVRGPWTLKKKPLASKMDFLGILGCQQVPKTKYWFSLFAFFFRGFCALRSRPSLDGSRAPFWTHFGKSRSDFGMDFAMNFVTFVGNFERKSRTDRAQNPAVAKTLHKILQTPWATPPAGTNSEGAAVSR